MYAVLQIFFNVVPAYKQKKDLNNIDKNAYNFYYSKINL